MDDKTERRDLTISDIALLQELQIELLSKVIKICERNDLTYFAYYGTLLGAVRHKSHIPWDDDIDIAMPRKDFNKFIKIAKASESKDFKLWWLTTDKNYPFNFAKIVGVRDDRFCNMYPGLPDKFNGPRMDIFPLDSVGSRLGGVLLIVKAFRKVAYIEKRLREKTNIKIPAFSKFILHRLLSFMSANHRAQYYISLFSVYSKEKECIPKVEFYGRGYSSCHLPFGKLNVRAPLNYEGILTRIYGDYMQYPPKGERLGRHPFVKWIIPKN